MEPSCPLPTTEGLISLLLRSMSRFPPVIPTPVSHLTPPRCERGNWEPKLWGEKPHGQWRPAGDAGLCVQRPIPLPPPPPVEASQGRDPGARVGHREENKGRLLSHSEHGGLRAGGSTLLKARTPGTGAIRWRSRCRGAAVPAAMLLSRRAPGFFDACEAAPLLSAEASGSSPSTAAATGAEGLWELAWATVLWGAGTERPPRRSR